jgi:hypothetical protein
VETLPPVTLLWAALPLVAARKPQDRQALVVLVQALAALAVAHAMAALVAQIVAIPMTAVLI